MQVEKVIEEFSNEHVVKQVRQHYEVMITLWDWELKNKILDKHFLDEKLKIKKVYDVSQDNRTNLHINKDCFVFVERFMLVLHSILHYVPQPKGEDNKFYVPDRYEDLYNCMLAVIEKVVLALGCRPDVLRQDQDSKGNQLLIDLFKNTHSDEGFEIFEPITYKKLKKEG